MFRKILKGALIGAAALALSVPAQADIEVNMFGASAQFNYWSEFGAAFLADDANVNCPDADLYHAVGSVSERDNFIAICLDNGTINTTGGTVSSQNGGSTLYNDNVVVRYSTFSSAPGLQAAIGTLTDPDGCGTSMRLMADKATTVFTPVAPNWIVADECATAPAAGGVTTTTCTEVNIGCADTGPECFTQTTQGPTHTQIFPEDAGDQYCEMGEVSEWNSGNSLWEVNTPPDLTGFGGLTQRSPFIVPFAFFRNDTAGHGDDLGNITNAAGIKYMNNITRSMAGLIFSGVVPRWNLFLDDDDKGFDDQVMVCIRHSGSGTHATFDWTVMRPFYTTYAGAARHPGNFFVAAGQQSAIMTNKGSSDEMRCVGWNGGLDTDRCPERPEDHNFTAIGYADYDKLGDTSTNDCSNVPEFADVPANPDVAVSPDNKGRAARLCYQGSEANFETVSNCRYDFWGAQVCIYPENENNAQDIFGDIMTYASRIVPPACPSTPIPADEMECDRADCTSPIRVRP